MQRQESGQYLLLVNTKCAQLFSDVRCYDSPSAQLWTIDALSISPLIKHHQWWSGRIINKPEADIVEGFVINAVCLIGVFNQLMDRKCGVVWFNDGVGDLWWWDNGECVHDAIWVFFTDLGNEKCSHTGSSTTTERVCELNISFKSCPWLDL